MNLEISENSRIARGVGAVELDLRSLCEADVGVVRFGKDERIRRTGGVRNYKIETGARVHPRVERGGHTLRMIKKRRIVISRVHGERVIDHDSKGIDR